MHLDAWTVALQTLNFLVLVWLLWRFLFRPVRAVIEKRKALAETAFREADARAEAAEAERMALEEARGAVAAERKAKLRQIHEELELERAALRKEAAQDADAMVAKARTAIAEERSAAVNGAREDVIALATDLAAALLRQTDDDAHYDRTLDRIESHIAGLPAAEQARLTDDLAQNGGRLLVVTARPLPGPAEHRWRTRLNGRLGDTVAMDFDSDPSLVGGAELQFPHARLRFSWADQLEQAKELLRDHDTA